MLLDVRHESSFDTERLTFGHGFDKSADATRLVRLQHGRVCVRRVPRQRAMRFPMKPPSKDDRRIREVKAILEGLQRYSTSGHSIATAADETAAARGRMVKILSAMALVGAGAVALTIFFTQTNNSTPETLSRGVPASSAQPKQDAVVKGAMALLTAGRIQSAREQLTPLATANSVDAAWALARSYDPNFLRTIAGADAAPDVIEAQRWYRTWYALAVKEGLVADSISLERIVKSMQ